MVDDPISINSPYFKETSTSIVVPLAALEPSVPPVPEQLKNAHRLMQAAKAGTFEKRKPIGVAELGNGHFKVLDGNTTFHALLELGETEAVVEVLKDGRRGDV